MKNFGRDNRQGRGRSFGKRDFGGNQRFGRPQMHKAVCDNCGKECEVPFRPTGEKPVYCSDCFAKMNGDRNEKPQFSKFDRGNRNQNTDGRELKAINEKLDKILSLLTSNVSK